MVVDLALIGEVDIVGAALSKGAMESEGETGVSILSI